MAFAILISIFFASPLSIPSSLGDGYLPNEYLAEFASDQQEHPGQLRHGFQGAVVWGNNKYARFPCQVNGEIVVFF
ncbi:MAG: hypothetical protein HY789_15485 [Deltaproteobacteria bacterium]|nr:hypothetical protein [Deltaproteobacteria bacterium]